MISANDLKRDSVFILGGHPHKVLESSHMKKGRQGATVQLKLKNLVTGSIISKNVSSNERFEPADIEKRELVFIYNHRGECVFSDPNDKSNRISIKESDLVYEKEFLKGGLLVVAEYFDDKFIGVKLPIKIDYKVVDAPPNVKGNTAGGGTKMVTIETGAKIQTPLFIEEGDIIKINTEKGEYVERLK